jgi:hypothetical protein
MSAVPSRFDQIADRFEIGELLDRYAHAIDSWDWDLLRTVFTDDAVVDFSSVGQYVEGEATIRGLDAIIAWYTMALEGFFGVLHFMGNHRVLLDGDRATAKSYMHVLSMPMGGVYETAAVRTPEGWRISLMVLDERRFEAVEARLQSHMAAVDETTSP